MLWKTQCQQTRKSGARWCSLSGVDQKEKQKTTHHAGGFHRVGENLFFRAVASQVSSAPASLTSVFGMGTGGPSRQSTPTIHFCRLSRRLDNNTTPFFKMQPLFSKKSIFFDFFLERSCFPSPAVQPGPLHGAQHLGAQVGKVLLQLADELCRVLAGGDPVHGTGALYHGQV